MSFICQVDQTQHDSIELLHTHLRRFKIKQADYYTTYHPRFCKGTGKPIPYKDYSQYHSQDFIDKNAIKAFIKANPKEGREWAVDWLRKRKEEKGLVYAPSQVELRSLQCPSMPYYDSVGGYYNICRELGFKERYVSYARQNTAQAGFWDGKCIVCDTREQLPLNFPVKTVKEKLDYGDYTIAVPHNNGVYVERKGLGDFVGTLNCRKVTRKKGNDSSFERFDRELARAVANGHYVVMVVESGITQALSFSYLPQMKWTKVSESHVFKNLRDLLAKYPLNFQAVFVENRIDAVQKVMEIFRLGGQVQQIDLQDALERGQL